MNKVTSLLLLAGLFFTLSSPSVQAGSDSGPVLPHSPLAGRLRAQAILHAQMAEFHNTTTSHAVAFEVSGNVYLVTLSGGGESVVYRDNQGAQFGNAWVHSPGLFVVSVASNDGSNVYCRIYDQWGAVLSSVDGGSIVTCSVRGW